MSVSVAVLGMTDLRCHSERRDGYACALRSNHTPAQAHVAVIEHEVLSRRRRPLRRREDGANAATACRRNITRCVRHPVTRLRSQLRAMRRWLARDPMHVDDIDFAAI